jgi:asparagine synthase (glutamine-hydrolysing)
MCRIAGIYSVKYPISSIPGMVKKMCDLQKHGGPDDEGFFVSENQKLVLGHRRLSLIDLSVNGHQPMHYQNRYTISFNGEIYNYLELKNELFSLGNVFIGNSDTEVILAAYSQWGSQSFAKLKGMFAFALWDSEEDQLYLVRDAAGIKPLYYHCTETGLHFASEIKAFQFLEDCNEENENWPVFFMAYGHIPEPVTTLKEVKSLPKGCFIKYNTRSNDFTLQSFKHYSFSEIQFSKIEAEKAVYETLKRAVKSHLIADAPIGVFVSGGIDSGIMAALASQQKKEDLHSLSIYFEEKEFSEKNYQDILINHLQCKSHQYLLKETDFEENLPQVLSDMDMPCCDGVNTWFISKSAKEQGLKAVLSGIGGDELFGGYPSFNRIGFTSLLHQIPNGLLKAGKFSNDKRLNRLSYLAMDGIKGTYLFLRGHFTAHEIASQLGMYETEVWNILNDSPMLQGISKLSSKNQASWMEFNLYMQNQLLRDADTMGMAHGIEIRVPFLDDDFIKMAFQICPEVKYDSKIPKSLLINSFRNVLPKSIWDRPKMGFSFPFKTWLSQSEYVKDAMKEANVATKLKYKKFIDGDLHWSHMMSLLILKNSGRA